MGDVVRLVDRSGRPVRKPEDPCDHGVVFDSEAARGLSAHDVRRLFPRLFGACPYGCGFSGIAYASKEHFVMGDW